MTTDLCEGVFNQVLLETAKNDHFETIFKIVPLRPPHLENDWIFKLSTNFLFIKLGSAKFGWFWFILSRVTLEKPFEGHLNLSLRTGSVDFIIFSQTKFPIQNENFVVVSHSSQKKIFRFLLLGNM